MTYQLQFGSYTLPNTITVAQVGMARRIPSANSARVDGAHTLSGLLNLKKFALKGGIFWPLGSSDRTWLRGQLDALKAGLAQGPANFTTDSDRFYRLCQAESYTDDYEPTGFNRLVMISFDVVTGDPYSYEVAAQSGTGAISGTGGTKACANGGNAPAAPAITIVVGTTGVNTLQISNGANGDACTISGTLVSGDTIVIDSLTSSVTLNGNATTGIALFDGQFIRLQSGANTLTFAKTVGSYTSAAVAWNNRWF
jgi:phage-related protein